MSKYIAIIRNPLYMMFIIVSGIFVAITATVFIMVSPKVLGKFIAEHGIVALLFDRFKTFAGMDIILSMPVFLISFVIILLSKNKDFKEPVRVLIVSIIFQIICALIGSSVFILLICRSINC